jgi:hypothetical protein
MTAVAPVYLDFNATTPVEPAVADAMLAQADHPRGRGDALSLHAEVVHHPDHLTSASRTTRGPTYRALTNRGPTPQPTPPDGRPEFW